MDTVDYYRRQATHAGVRARLAEDEASALRLQLRLAYDEIEGLRGENQRLRALGDRLEAAASELREQLRERRTGRPEVTIEALIRSIAAAVDEAESEITDRTFTTVSAELRLALALDGNAPALAVAAPGVYPTGALSTVSIDLRKVPPVPLEEARRQAAGLVLAAVLELQRAVERDFPEHVRPAAAASLIQASAYAASRPLPNDVPVMLSALCEALEVLADRVPIIRERVLALWQRCRATPAAPSREDLERLAALLDDVNTTLR